MRPDAKLGGLSQAQHWLFYEFLFIDGEPIDAHFIRFEGIESSLSELSSITGVVPRFSKSGLHFKNSKTAGLPNYRHFFSDEQVELVARRFSEYLNLTGYRF
jgi:hypothetical protein